MSLFLQHCFCLSLYYIFFIHFYVLSSKFNFKPVLNSQINHGFLPITPKRSARGFFTAGLYLTHNQLVILYFDF